MQRRKNSVISKNEGCKRDGILRDGTAKLFFLRELTGIFGTGKKRGRQKTGQNGIPRFWDWTGGTAKYIFVRDGTQIKKINGTGHVIPGQNYKFVNYFGVFKQ